MKGCLLIAVAIGWWLCHAQPGLAEPRVRTVPELVNLLRSDIKALRLLGIRELGKMGSPAAEALDALGKLLRDPDPDIKTQAGHALAQIGPKAVPIFIKELQFPEHTVRLRAARNLAAMGPDAHAAVPALTATLKFPHAEVRTMAALALGEIGPAAKKSAPSLVPMLIDANPKITAQ